MLYPSTHTQNVKREKYVQYTLAVADLGFPRGGGANSPGGRQHTILPNFPKKLHEIERIWAPGGGARPKFYYVDPPLISSFDCNVKFLLMMTLIN